MPACPICKRTASPRETNAAFPFCTARCKQVDLGKWLDEAYRVPTDEDALDGGPDDPRDADGQRKMEDA